MREVLVRAKGVAVDFPLQDATAVNVLSNIDCEIRDRDRIALVGASGSGKSTLLHILGGLMAPTRGEVSWPALGVRDSLQPEKIALVFQTPSLFPALSIAENVALPLRLAGRDTDGTKKAEALLDRFGLGELALKLPEELSGGQAQRVAMARALIIQPRLVLADEPTGQLDSATATQFLETVRTLLADTTTAMLIATHDPAVAARMDHRWTIRHGHLQTTQKNEMNVA